MSFGPEYPKINTLFKRDPRTKVILINEPFAQDEFEYLRYNPWQWTEKLDGTNIRLNWTDSCVTIGGRTDRAVLPKPLNSWLLSHIDPVAFLEAFGPTPSPQEVTVYGEGVGPGIQGNPLRLIDPCFIMFDIKIGRFWLSQDNVEGLAVKLGFPAAPRIDYPYSIEGAVEAIKEGRIKSMYAEKIEGIVGRPGCTLRTNFGDRITVKVKTVDFEKLEEYYDKVVPILG